MEKRANRQWIVVVIVALLGLFLGIVCGVMGGGVIGYLLGQRHGGAQAEAPAACPEGMVCCPEEKVAPVRPTLEARPLPLPGVPWRRSGALIVEVLADTPAERAGLRPGDVITAVDGKEVGGNQPLSKVIKRYKPGDRVSLTVQRGEEVMTVNVELAQNPDDPSQGYLGVRVQDLGQLVP